MFTIWGLVKLCTIISQSRKTYDTCITLSYNRSLLMLPNTPCGFAPNHAPNDEYRVFAKHRCLNATPTMILIRVFLKSLLRCSSSWCGIPFKNALNSVSCVTVVPIIWAHFWFLQLIQKQYSACDVLLRNWFGSTMMEGFADAELQRFVVCTDGKMVRW